MTFFPEWKIWMERKQAFWIFYVPFEISILKDKRKKTNKKARKTKKAKKSEERWKMEEKAKDEKTNKSKKLEREKMKMIKKVW